MPSYRVQARLAYDTGLPEDVAVNVWHVVADDDASTLNFMNDLVTFYQAVDGLFSALLDASAAAHSMKAYDLADAEPRAPVSEITFSTPDASGTPLPPEVAACLSFQAIQVSGSPQARRRGRVYLGPLETAVLDGAGRLSTTTTDTIRDAADALLTASNASAVYAWGIYSRVDSIIRDVDNGWVDDAVDIQRRRGDRPTRRDTFS